MASDLPTVDPPDKDSRFPLLELTWYGFDDPALPAQTDDWLQASEEYLTEATPRRFGTYEPLRHQLAKDGADGLRTLTAQEDNVSFRATGPCLEGSFDRHGRFLMTSIGLFASALQNPGWMDAVREFFIAYAERRRAFLAIGEVIGRVGWSGRSTWYDEKTQRSVRLCIDGIFLGLPPYPVWWSWYGTEYRNLVEPYLDPGGCVTRPAGLFHQAATEPRLRKALPDPVPVELRTHGGKRHQARYPVPVRRAANVPAKLLGDS